jgi:hypothetical protein
VQRAQVQPDFHSSSSSRCRAGVHSNNKASQGRL